MTTTRVLNNTKHIIRLPNRQTLAPGVAGDVPVEVLKHTLVAGMVERGVLSTGGQADRGANKAATKVLAGGAKIPGTGRAAPAAPAAAPVPAAAPQGTESEPQGEGEDLTPARGGKRSGGRGRSHS